jgi:putative transposase
MKSYKTELDLNNKQRTQCLQHAGAARFAYNWGLQRKIEEYKAGRKTPTAIDLHRELNALKKAELSWLYETSKCAPQEALRNLDIAYKNFFRRCETGAKVKGFPIFKSRKQGIGSFTLTGAIKATATTIQLPRLGILRLEERGYFPVDERITSATVSERAGHWFVAIMTNVQPHRKLGTEVLGIDVGIKTLATVSDGTIYENPKALYAAEKHLRRLQKSVSRKIKGSRNRKKAVARLSRQHYKVSCVRKDAIHKATNVIAKRSAVLGIESLNVSGMIKNHHLAKALADASMSEFHRQLHYKMGWSGGIVVSADRFYPSSKTCSRCGIVKEDLSLLDRVFRCECGLEIDRDLNAAINLRNLAVRQVLPDQEAQASKACGEESSGSNPIRTKLSSKKQEPNTMMAVA